MQIKHFVFSESTSAPHRKKKNIPGSAPVDTSGSRPEPSTLQREVHAHRLVALGKVYYPHCAFSLLLGVFMSTSKLSIPSLP